MRLEGEILENTILVKDPSANIELENCPSCLATRLKFRVSRLGPLHLSIGCRDCILKAELLSSGKYDFDDRPEKHSTKYCSKERHFALECGITL